MATTTARLQMRARVALVCVLLCLLAAHVVVHADVAADHIVEVAVSAQGGLDVDHSYTIPKTTESPSHEPMVSRADSGQQNQLAAATADSPAEEVVRHEKQQQPSRVPTGDSTNLAKELEALELMIKLQEKKLALLEKIRSKTLSEQDTESSYNHNTHAHRAKLHSSEHFEDLIERKIEAMTASAIEDLMANHLSQTTSCDSRFVAKAVIPMQQQQQHEIAGMKMMKLRPGGHQELLVLAFASGVIEFYLPPSPSLLLQIVSSDELIIRAIELDLHSDSPSLAVIYEQPQAAVYALELTQNGRHLMGNQQDNSTLIPITTATSKSVFTSAPGSRFSLKVAELSRIQLPSAPNALAITKTARRSVLTIGDDDGSLQFFALNGTLLHKMATNALIRTMAAQRNLVAFSNGSSTVLLPLARGRDTAFIVCQGSTAQVTSVALDPVHSDVVYAGTSHGEVLVFSTKDSSGGLSEGPAGACRMVARVLLRDQPALSRQRHHHLQTNTRVYALKDFMIASTGSSIAVYNVSQAQDGAVSMEIVCTLPTIENSHSFADNDKPMDRPLTISEGNYVTNVAFAVDYLTGGEHATSGITVFQSLLSSKTEKSDTSWVGVLYIGIVIIVVLVCQFCCRRQQRSTPSPSDFDPWGALKNRKEAGLAAAVDGGTARANGSAYGEVDGDLEHLSQEMRASMSARTARDVSAGAVGKQGFLKRPPSMRPLSDRERFGPSYDALSDDLKRKIAEARQGTLECAFDDPDEDDDDEF